MIQRIDLPIPIRNHPTERIELLILCPREAFQVFDLLGPIGDLPVTAGDNMIQRIDLPVPIRNHPTERIELLILCPRHALEVVDALVPTSDLSVTAGDNMVQRIDLPVPILDQRIERRDLLVLLRHQAVQVADFSSRSATARSSESICPSRSETTVLSAVNSCPSTRFL